MRLNRLFLFLLCSVIATATFTSCLDDDDDDDVQENVDNAIRSMTGIYTGTLVSRNSNQYLDTVNVTWRVDKGGIHITNFPVALLAEGIVGDSVLKAQVAAQGTATMDVAFSFYNIGKEEFDFYTGPSMTFNIVSNGASRRMTTYFNPADLSAAGSYTIGYYLMSQEKMGFAVAITGLNETVNGKEQPVGAWKDYVYCLVTSIAKQQ